MKNPVAMQTYIVMMAVVNLGVLMKMFVSVAVAAMLTLSFSSAVLAHGGGLNKDGCHNNRKTGDYHCHR